MVRYVAAAGTRNGDVLDQNTVPSASGVIICEASTAATFAMRYASVFVIVLCHELPPSEKVTVWIGV